jgi:hypothetical protein
MDNTMECAINIISNPATSNWRKCYWINVVTDEISGFRAVGLNEQAELLENQLKVATTSKEMLSEVPKEFQFNRTKAE